MFEELVRDIKSNTLTGFPELRAQDELEAAITHWLQDNGFNFRFRSDELVELWHRSVEAFLCNRDGITLADVKNTIPFNSQERDFDFIDLFAGIGGFNLALQAHGGRCVFSSEWDKSAKITYFKNYGKIPFGDINQFTGENVTDEEIDALIPDHNVLAGGFPCQPFSHAGVSARTALGLEHGFECKTQGTLFHSIARIAYVKQPEIVFMENVKNIVTHNGGETFNIIRNTMENLSENEPGKHSYRFFYALVNSETLVAQRRIRCYMVCVRDDIWGGKDRIDFEFPIFGGDPIPLRDVLEDLTEDELVEYTISDKLWQGHINRTQRNLERNTGFTAHVADLDRPSNTIVARYGKDGKECLIPQEELGLNPRKLTKNECMRLFGYPENFWVPQAKTPTYKQFGNSVVVPAVQAIAGRISDYMEY